MLRVLCSNVATPKGWPDEHVGIIYLCDMVNRRERLLTPVWKMSMQGKRIEDTSRGEVSWLAKIE